VDNRRGSSAPATGIGKCSPPHPQPLAPSPDIWHLAPPPFGAIPPRHGSPPFKLARWRPRSREKPKDRLKTGRLCLKFFPKSYRQEMAPQFAVLRACREGGSRTARPRNGRKVLTHRAGTNRETFT
jgi:hypothetical protein